MRFSLGGSSRCSRRNKSPARHRSLFRGKAAPLYIARPCHALFHASAKSAVSPRSNEISVSLPLRFETVFLPSPNKSKEEFKGLEVDGGIASIDHPRLRNETTDLWNNTKKREKKILGRNLADFPPVTFTEDREGIYVSLPPPNPRTSESSSSFQKKKKKKISCKPIAILVYPRLESTTSIRIIASMVKKREREKKRRELHSPEGKAL